MAEPLFTSIGGATSFEHLLAVALKRQPQGPLAQMPRPAVYKSSMSPGPSPARSILTRYAATGGEAPPQELRLSGDSYPASPVRFESTGGAATIVHRPAPTQPSGGIWKLSGSAQMKLNTARQHSHR